MPETLPLPSRGRGAGARGETAPETETAPTPPGPGLVATTGRAARSRWIGGVLRDLRPALTAAALLATAACQRDLIPAQQFFYQTPESRAAGADAAGTDAGGDQATCGDGECAASETATSCPKDCDPVCGDGKCEEGEDGDGCPTDCTTTPDGCGDGKCDLKETAISCADDCGASNGCGDLSCDTGETEVGCPLDCDEDLAPFVICVGTNCIDELGDCTGDLTCTHVLNVALKCIDDCGGEVECVTQCGIAASLDNDKAAPLFKCTGEKCANG